MDYSHESHESLNFEKNEKKKIGIFIYDID